MKSPFNLNEDDEIQAPVQATPQLMGSLTSGTSQQAAPVPAPSPSQTINQDGKQYDFTPGANGSLTAKAPPGAPLNLNAPPPQAKTLPGMPIGADELGQYIANQKQAVSLYGPDQQMALEQKTLSDRNSFGNQLTSGLKGFSDALMQGVAGAGNPGNQQAFENQQDQHAREQMDVLQKAHEGQLQQTETGTKLDMMDPSSSVSKAYRQSFSPIFAKMGYSPKEISRMSASQVGTVADLGVRFADAQTQLELKKAMLGVETYKAGAEIQNQKNQRRMEGAKGLASLGVMGGFLHPEAKKEFEAETTGGKSDSFDPDVVAYSQKHGITPEQAQLVKQRRSS